MWKKTDVACDSLWFRRVDDAEKNSHTACREGNAARKFCEQEAAEKERDREREKNKKQQSKCRKKRNMENKMKSGQQSSLVSIAVKDKSA